MSIYTHSYSVILDDMDLNGYRLKPISAIKYMQDAFARFSATKHMAAYDLFPENLYWVIAELNMEFTAVLPFWSQEIKVEIWISELTALKIYTDFRLYYDNTIFAQGNGCWFILDQNTHRPVRTDIVAETFDICNEKAMGEHSKFSIEKAVEKISSLQHTINLSDIDFNSHVNNKSYITVAEATMADDFKKENLLKDIRISFKRETFLGDTIDCSTSSTAVANTYIHHLTKDDVAVCDIQTTWEKRGKEETILDWSIRDSNP